MGLMFASHFPADGLLIVGHGTRNPAGLAEFQELARQIAFRHRLRR